MTGRIGVLADPHGERWRGFAAAGRRAGLEVVCLPWAPLVRGRPEGVATLASCDLVRIDTPAGDAVVDASLCGRHRDPTEVLGAAAWARGLHGALARLVPDSAAWTPHPHDVAVLMDKAECHVRLLGAGLPVVPALPVVRGWRELVAAMAEVGWHRVFLKPRFGSSASGVLALAAAGGRFRATALMEVQHTTGAIRLYNRTRPLVTSDQRLLATIVDTLAPEGLHVERWAPKLVLGGASVDLRIVCVAGAATHVAVRLGQGPLTNLQAGAGRLALGAARQALGGAFDEAVDVAERAAAAFPRSLQLGVDVGVLADRRTVVVFEANAFGDHLLEAHDIDGRRRSTWDAQAEALAGGWTPPDGVVAAA